MLYCIAIVIVNIISEMIFYRSFSGIIRFIFIPRSLDGDIISIELNITSIVIVQ